MSVWPVASHTRTPLGIGIMAAPTPREPMPAPLRRRYCRRSLDALPSARFLSDPTPQSDIVQMTAPACSGIDGRLLAVDGSQLMTAGAKVVVSSASTRPPSRASRRHVNSWLVDMLF